MSASWDIYLDNVELINGSATTNVPTIIDKTTASFTTTLTNPGDYYMFTIDVVNNGSIDAMIEEIEKTPALTTNQSKYLNYIIEYQSGESITTRQSLEKNSFVRLKVKIEFRKDISASDLPTIKETLNLSFTVKYSQADKSGTTSVENNGKLVKVVSGDYDTVTMLSKYNLYVGGSYNRTTSTWTAYGEEATGIQDSEMIGYIQGQTTLVKGVTPFATVDKRGTKYNDYSGSIVEEYVNNYKKYIENYGITVTSAKSLSIFWYICI